MSTICLRQKLFYLIWDLLIVLGDFNLPEISWPPSTDSLVPTSVHDFADGLLELLLQQVSFIRNSLNTQLDLDLF